MRRTKEEAGKTREAILDSAETLFLRKGVSRTSLEEIARYAGMTRGAVYWHFKNKAHLINELAGQIFLPIEQVSEELESIDGSSLQKLHYLFNNIFTKLASNEKTRNIFIILLRRCEFTEELSEAEEQCNIMVENFINHCTSLLSEPDTIKRLRPGVSPKLAAQMLHIMILGILNDWARNPDQFNNEYQPENIIRAFFQGIVIDWE